MELGAEISQRVKKTIKKQLQTLGSYVDDELPEYIMVMIANKRTKIQMIEDLNLFLNDEAEKFVSWLFIMLERIQQAMKLPDLDKLMDSDNDSSKKNRKNFKRGHLSVNENDEEGEYKSSKSKEKIKRRFDGDDDDDNEKKKTITDEERKLKRDREERQKEREVKEKEEINKRRLRQEEDRKQKEKDCKEIEQKKQKREKEREEEIQKRRRDREKRNKEEKMKLEERERKQNTDGDSESIYKTKSASPKITEEEKQGDANDIRKKAEEEAKKIAKRKENTHNPMDFVKQIAKDINKRVMTVNNKSEKKEEKDEKIDVEKPTAVTKADKSSANISLQAVSQYGEGDIEIENKVNKSPVLMKKCRSISRSRSPTDRIRRSARNSDSASKFHGHRKRSRSGSKHRSRKMHRSTSKHRSQSRNVSKLRHRSGSRDRYRSRSLERNNSQNEKDYQLKSKQHYLSRDRRGFQSGGRNTLSSKDRYESSSRSEGKHRKELETRSIEDKDTGTGDLRKFIDPDSEDDKKKNIPSQVKVFTDFKRRPCLSKPHQASSALLKRAVTEAQKEVKKPKPVNHENNDEEETELDYTENIDDVLHKPDTNVALPSSSSGDRRVILDDVGNNLATITVNINTNTSVDRSRKKERNERSNNEPDVTRGRHSRDKYSVDARHTITKSRRNMKDSAVENTSLGKRSDDKFLGSMVADLEEKSRETKRIQERSMSWKQRRELTQEQRKRDLKRRRTKANTNSSDEETENASRVHELKAETIRVKEREEKRQVSVADTGDLRNLLRKKKDCKSPDSDNEDEIARKLREKIKEEKHKRLFGLLNDQDKLRLKQERSDLRQKLKEFADKKVSEQKEHYLKSCKIKNEIESEEDMNRDKVSDSFEVQDDDEWIEEDKSHSQLSENEALNANVKEVCSDKKEPEKPSDVDKNGGEVAKAEDDEESEEDGNSNSDVNIEEESAEEENEEKIETEDEQRNDHEMHSKTDALSQDALLHSMHADLNTDNCSKRDGEANKSRQKKTLKESISTSIHSEEPAQTAKLRKMAVSGGKHKSSRRRHMHQDFVVTLDGFEKKMSNSSSGNTDLSRESFSAHGRRERSSSRTQSDEEFERILKEKELRKKEIQSSRRHRPTSRRTSRHKRRHKRSGSENLSLVDKEILLAEQKLETQRLLKKSLNQVQNLDTLNFSTYKHESVISRTAYINPHFQRKELVSGQENVNKSITEQPHPTTTIAVPLPSNTATEMLTVSFNEGKSLPPSSPNLKFQQFTTLLSPTSSTQSSMTTTIQATDKPVTMTSVSPTMMAAATSVSRAAIQERCSYWPDCKNKACQYIHPTSPCKMFPNCSFGDRCIYIHPKCKFGDRCTNSGCIYSHATTTSGFQLQVCKFGSTCTKMDCVFKHPIPKLCRFGTSCANVECLYQHQKPVAVVNPSQLKWIAGKPPTSERKFAVGDVMVTKAPVSIETSKC